MMKILLLITMLVTGSNKLNAADIVIHNEDEKNRPPILDRSFLVSVFTKKRKFWDNGRQITVFIKPINSVEHSLFLTEWLGMSRYRYKKIIETQIYSGKSLSVNEVQSDEEMMYSILTTPDSIGYLFNGSLVYSHGNADPTKIEVYYYYE